VTSEGTLPPDPFIDIHTHGAGSPSAFTLYNLSAQQLAELVRSGAGEADGESGGARMAPAGPLPESLLHRHPRLSAGLHPWAIATSDLAATLAGLERLARQPVVWALGECGLDRLIATPLPQQESVFLRQAEIAAAVDKPLIVHCVRAHNELLRLLKRARPGVPVIVHGYNNRPEIAAQLLRQGLYLSFGRALLDGAAPARRVLVECPADCFFLETDDAGVAIETIYAAAAECRGESLETVRRRIGANFSRVFSKPSQV